MRKVLKWNCKECVRRVRTGFVFLGADYCHWDN